MELELKKVFVTKFALTKGVISAELMVDKGYKFCRGKLLPSDIHDQAFWGNEFFFTLTEALMDAERRRTNKIKLLKMNIEKLNNLKFNEASGD